MKFINFMVLLCLLYIASPFCVDVGCSPSFCFNDSGNQCKSCPTGCICSSDTYCNQCEGEYYQDQDANLNYICQLCGDNCICSYATNCSGCEPGYYIVFDSNGDNMCLSCGPNCDCSNDTYCGACANNFYRITNSDNNYQCTTCSLNCDCSSGVYCQGCQVDYYRRNDGQGNYECSTCPSNCICSNDTYCNQCNSGEFRQTDSNNNFDCKSCGNFKTLDSDIGTSYCKNCISKVYSPGNNTCIEVCGDGIAQGDYQCDLGTGTQWNGCSDTCQIQDNFTCKINNQNQSICSYTGQYDYTLIDYSKELFQNKVTLRYKVYPPLSMFTQIDPNTFMSLDQVETSSFTYDSQSDVFSVTFAYSFDISKQKIILTLNGSTQTDERFYASQASEWKISLTTNQDFPFLYYTSEQYTFSQAIFYLSYILVILALVSFLLGIFAPNRLSSLEAMFVVQYAFISLIWFPKYLALPFYCLINLKYSTAYNYPFLKPTPTAVVPPQLYTLGLSASSFYSNVNFCCVVFVIAWIGLVVSKILVNVKGSKIEEERRSLKDTFTRDQDEIIRINKEDERLRQKAEKIEMRFEFFCELTLYFVMFNLSYLVACSVTFYIYGNQEDIGSFILSAFLLLNSLITIVIFIKFNVYFQRFRYTFRPSSLTFLHYIFHIQCIVLSIVMMIVLKDYPWVPFVPQIILFIYTIVNKPYNYLQENIRSCFNLLVMMAVTSMIVFGFYIDDVTYTSMNSYIYPMIIQVLLFVVVVWGLVITLQDIILDCMKKQKKNLSYDIFDDEKTVKQLQKKIIQQNLTARNILLSATNQNYFSMIKENNEKMKQQINKKSQELQSLNQGEKTIRIKEILRENNLPETDEAVNELISELTFLKFQKIIREKNRKYTQPAKKQLLIEYENIEMTYK